MRPALSVIILTVLIGAGQGLFLAVYAAQWSARLGWLGAAPTPVPRGYLVTGAGVAVVLALAGLVASFFHLGRPERAWRTAACWRTSWLSREVIALPAFLVTAAFYGWAVHTNRGSPLAVGMPAAIAAVALFVCTGMVYAGIRFLREWASPLTVINFTLLGGASGFTLAAVLAVWLAPELFRYMAVGALALTVGALATRAASLRRNARLVPKSTLQSAIGVKHPRIVQIAQGFMGSSFNTREFFHGVAAHRFQLIKWSFLVLAFGLPIVLLALALVWSSPRLAFGALLTQTVGLLAERWFFLAQANHPQNLYYQSMA
ncbi:MAG: DmsC/YnfH family molybdoenzyme membrane anchor subunit [Casimicrobiaceae bacterium]